MADIFPKRSKNSTSSTKCEFFVPNTVNNGVSFFDFCKLCMDEKHGEMSKPTGSTNKDVLFSTNPPAKIAALSFDWLTHVRYLIYKSSLDCNESLQVVSNKRPLPKDLGRLYVLKCPA